MTFEASSLRNLCQPKVVCQMHSAQKTVSSPWGQVGRQAPLKAKLVLTWLTSSHFPNNSAFADLPQ